MGGRRLGRRRGGRFLVIPLLTLISRLGRILSDFDRRGSLSGRRFRQRWGGAEFSGRRFGVDHAHALGLGVRSPFSRTATAAAAPTAATPTLRLVLVVLFARGFLRFFGLLVVGAVGRHVISGRFGGDLRLGVRVRAAPPPASAAATFFALFLFAVARRLFDLRFGFNGGWFVFDGKSGGRVFALIGL